MRRRLLLSALLCCLWCVVGGQRWRDYMAYYNTTAAEQVGSLFYVLADGSLYSYNTLAGNITIYDKAGLLNDCDISMIRYDGSSEKLIIVYADNNIDLLSQNDVVTNMNGLYVSPMPYDNTVNGIFISQTSPTETYLYTNSGIVAIDLEKGVFGDALSLGFAVEEMSSTSDSLYTLTDSMGMMACSTLDPFRVRSMWHKSTTDLASLPSSASPYAVDASALSLPSPQGPDNNNFYYMIYVNKTLYTVGGFQMPGFTDPQNDGIIQIMRQGEWIMAGKEEKSTIGNKFVDNNCIAVDPLESNRFFASGKTGLYEFLNDTLVRVYSPDTADDRTLITYADLGNGKTSRNFIMTQGISFDSEGNLWILQSQSSRPLVVLKRDGTWEDHSQPILFYNDTGVSNLIKPIFDRRGWLWFVNYNWQLPSLFAYDPSSGVMRRFTRFVNQYGFIVANIYPTCVEEDINGNIWMGSDGGMLLLDLDGINSLSEIDNDNVIFYQPVLDNSILLGGEIITTIINDSDESLWVATTTNGVYRLNSSADSILLHFTSSNSGLLTDEVLSIAIDTLSRRIFFGTSFGLCSYEEATADIPPIEKDKKEDKRGIYDIGGRYVKRLGDIPLTKGLYIENGKKILRVK